MNAPKQTVSSGQKFNRWTVISEVRVGQCASKPEGFRGALCRCDCGNESSVRIRALIKGTSGSCGCYKSEVQSRRAIERNVAGEQHPAYKHGVRDHYLYGIWKQMKQRCENPNHPQFQDWGGRGISVCPEWHDSFTFLTYCDDVLGPRPARHSIDRIDNDGNYEPGNVRWADRVTQSNNRRKKVNRNGVIHEFQQA